MSSVAFSLSVVSMQCCLLFALQVASHACSYPCQCPSQALQCPAGISLLLDGCGCCKVCARQLGELCSLKKPCDHHKGLYCAFSNIKRDSSICLAHEGATCDLFGKIYLNGESFQPSCKLRCVCMDGAIGCVPLCTDRVRLPSLDCPFPHQVKLQNRCCEEWVCKGGSLNDIQPCLFTYCLKNGPCLCSLQQNCLVQTTEWSTCSKTCGMGISTRVTNDNPQCRLEKESRLCIIRFCNAPWKKNIKKAKKCVRSPKLSRAIRFEFTGCTSIHFYQPRFCGGCTDGRCCTPHATSTLEVEFMCPEGESFMRKMMVIRSCSCHYDCPADNDIFLSTYHRRMTGDHIKLET
uniref:CCN family member 3 n=1 Tax=Salvator merianae TaxID=96440 RepID=A0A8D0B6W7_SALMN